MQGSNLHLFHVLQRQGKVFTAEPPGKHKWCIIRQYEKYNNNTSNYHSYSVLSIHQAYKVSNLILTEIWRWVLLCSSICMSKKLKVTWTNVTKKWGQYSRNNILCSQTQLTWTEFGLFTEEGDGKQMAGKESTETALCQAESGLNPQDAQDSSPSFHISNLGPAGTTS